MKAVLTQLAKRVGFHVPVRIRRGPAKGAWWTAYPHSAYWRKGGAEPELERVVRELGCRAGQVSWDLGAHFGIYSVAMGRAVGARGQVVAVEPDPESFRRLSRHIRMNCLEQIVRAVNAGASDRSGSLAMHFSQGTGATTSHFFYEDEPHSDNQFTMNVPVVALDDLVARGEIRVPSFIKVDVEGHGGKALAGSLKSIGQSSPVILMGFHGRAELAATRTLLEPLGYRPHAIEGGPIAWPENDFTSTLILKRA